MMDTPLQETVSAFFKGKLSPEARQELLASLDHDAELRREFDFQEALMLGIQAQMAAAEWAETPVPVRAPWPTYRRYLVAATIVLCLGFVWWRLDSPAPSDWETRALAFAGPLDHLDGETKGDHRPTPVDSIAYWLRASDYTRLQDRLGGHAYFSEMPSLASTQSDTIYALALAYLHAEPPHQNLEKAASLFDAIIQRSEDAVLRTWARKQQVVLAIKQGDTGQARAYLQALADDPYDPSLHNQAQQLLEQMEGK